MRSSPGDASERRVKHRPRPGLGWFNWMILTAVLVVSAWWFHFREPPARPGAGASPAAAVSTAGRGAGATTARPAMTVTTVVPSVADWPVRLPADGSIAAWQEVSISPEVGGLRLAEVLVGVGDRVAKGQVLAVLAATSVANDLALQTASLAEARATLAEASGNASRARQLRDSGAISVQQINQYLTAEATARARVQAADARLRSEQLRLSQTRIVAADDGVIAGRAATVGAVAQAGQELFRLIRQGRLEWRAEVPATDLSRILVGQPVQVTLPDGATAAGTVRIVAPTIDPQTRNGLVYVDLATSVSGAAAPDTGPAIRAGMFASGSFLLGRSQALTVPAASVLLRDGFAYLFKLAPDARVALAKVRTGRRQDDRIEIVDGLLGGETIVESGVGFLADGDLVAVTRSIR